MEAFACRPRVLIVDDAPENVQLLTEMLRGDCLPVSASNGVQALKLANDDPAPDIILLDILMPGMNGYEVCARLKAEKLTRDIPVIFVTALTEKNEERKGLELGGADYITRPFNAELVKKRIRHQLEIRKYRDLLEGTAALHTAELETAYLQLQVELSERKRQEEELSHQRRALELRVAERNTELAAAMDELRQEIKGRTEDRKEIHLLEENLARQKQAFEIVNRELESLSYSISHDLRAPLRHLVGFSGALQEDYGDKLDDTAQTFLDCMAKAGRKMESQIDALLSLSRITRQELTLASVDLSDIVRECAASLQASEPERRAVFTVADKLSVRADANLLRAAIGNLLENAWKFTGKREAATIEFGQKREGDAEVFFLRDNGAGFDMRYASRLFGAFQRMHNESEFEGMGVGLATVQRIIHRHGGRIWADAAVEGGATFFFSFPTDNS
ncbi:MAG TPA: response regulator [Geomonas sp.]